MFWYWPTELAPMGILFFTRLRNADSPIADLELLLSFVKWPRDPGKPRTIQKM